MHAAQALVRAPAESGEHSEALCRQVAQALIKAVRVSTTARCTCR